MRIVICALARNEHEYINDWVKHYFSIGFDKIYLYDNDDIDKPYIGDFIDSKYLQRVEIINIRGIHKEKLQHDIYTDFYNSHHFDWCLFVDIDEFLVGVSNIHLWLEQWKFRNAKQIRIKWKLFGDDDLIERDISKPVYDVFKKEVKTSLHRNLVDKGNLELQGKAFVRGGLQNVVIRSPHFASYFRRDNVIPSVLPSGKPCFSKNAIEEDYRKENVFINHYMTKSLSEFIKQKLNRGDAVYNTTINIDYYWRINNKTKEKLDYLKNMGLDINN